MNISMKMESNSHRNLSVHPTLHFTFCVFDFCHIQWRRFPYSFYISDILPLLFFLPHKFLFSILFFHLENELWVQERKICKVVKILLIILQSYILTNSTNLFLFFFYFFDLFDVVIILHIYYSAQINSI